MSGTTAPLPDDGPALRHEITCVHCGRTGMDLEHYAHDRCVFCQGKGTLTVEAVPPLTPCPTCGGTGRTANHASLCLGCQGTGVQPARGTLRVVR